MIADTLRLEEKNYRNIETLMQLLKASGPDATSQELYENAVEADKGIILLYKNLCEAWAEAQNLFRKADEAIKENKEESDKYHDELNEKIDEVNNYLNALIRELEGHVEDAVDQISGVVQTLHRIITYPTDTPNNVIKITPTIQTGYTEIAKAQEYHGGDPHSYSEKSVKLPFNVIKTVDTEPASGSYSGFNYVEKSDYDLYVDATDYKYRPVYTYTYYNYFDTATWNGLLSHFQLLTEITDQRIIDYEAVIKARPVGDTNYTKEEVLPFIPDAQLHQSNFTPGTKRIICGGRISVLRNTDDGLNLIFDFRETKDKVNNDPTNYELPKYIKVFVRVRIADMAQEVIL